VSRRLLLVLVVVAAVVGGGLWALPEIVRRVAVARIPALTGRAVSIGDVDLNLFTGHLAVKQLRLADRTGSEPFVEFERLDVRISLPSLLGRHLSLTEIVLATPAIRVVRTGPAELNFSDLLAPSPGVSHPTPASARWSVSLDRLSITRGTVRLEDRAVSPAAEWLVRDLGVDLARVTTRAAATAGRLAVHAAIDDTVLDLHADPLRLEPLRVGGQVSLRGFDPGRLIPYVYAPLGIPHRPHGGRVGLVISADLDSDAGEIRKAVLSGSLTVEGQGLIPADRPEPFARVSRLGVEIKEADLIARVLTVSRVEIAGLEVSARRDARGVIDLLDRFQRAGTAAPPAAPAPAAAPPGLQPAPRTLFPILQGLARGFAQIRVEQIVLEKSRAVFVDEAVRPTATLGLTDLQARLDDLTWPVTGPATLALRSGLPGGGTVEIRGPVTVLPFDAELKVALRDAPVEPYQPYIPVPARLSGRFNGDSENRIAVRDGRLVAVSKGNSWARDVVIRAPGAERPAFRVERMELVGIDFDWPRRGAVARASFLRPAVEIERAADGSVNLRRLFTPAETAAPDGAVPRPAAPAPPAAGPKPPGLLETMSLDFREVRIEDGSVRFLDRTASPAFSEDLSRLQVTVTGLGNRPGQRARLSLRGVVGGDAGLEVTGEVGPVGATTFVDVLAELHRFKLASVNPYASAATGWVVQRGDLEYTVRLTLDGDQLAASNDVVLQQLRVAPASESDQVKRRVGLPLGMIVALAKDQKGDIRASVPVTGTVGDPKFALGDAIWTAVTNAFVNLVTAPFKALGGLFSQEEKLEEPRLGPVTFEAGSAALTPPMEEHLLRVGDFLRRSPFVNLALQPVTGAADVEALKGEAATARLQAFQRERGLTDAAAALAVYYRERLPDVPLPETVEEQRARLREREPVPTAALAELQRQRLEATRGRLEGTEGIPPERLTAGESPAGSEGPGRIEFTLVPRGD